MLQRFASSCRRFPLPLLFCMLAAGCRPPDPVQRAVCSPAEVVRASQGLSLEVEDRVVKTIGPEYFGFNLENTEFQLSLWDADKQRVSPEVTAYLKEHFPGAIYRYPGGTTSNYHRWQQSVGGMKSRGPVRINDWIDLPRIEFGVDEYLDFVRATGGQAWYVLNIKGDIDKMQPIEKLADEAAGLVRHIGARKVPVLRWELGNELDRFHEKWPSERYISRAQTVMKAVRGADAQARFVSMMADFDAQSDLGISAAQYNKALASGLKGEGIHEYAQHLYYDGPPDGPPVTNRIEHLCQSISNARAAGIPAQKAAFWITEHARWPKGGGEDWNKNWRLSADLGASISLSDLIIASMHLPEVRGTGLHSLHGSTGPWPMFHRPEGAGAFHPSVVMHAYALLRATMLPQVLATKNASGNPTDYDGGYSARGVVMRNADRNRYSAWAINRDASPVEVTLKVAALAGRVLRADLASIHAENDALNNYDRQVIAGASRKGIELRFDAGGVARYTLAPHSVSGLSLSVPGQ